jgi:chromate reductase
MIDKQRRVLAISGSLRAGSSNSAILRAAQRLAPVGMRIDLYEDLGSLPHFNPDLDDTDTPPSAVAELRALVGAADGLIISSPEYAHGVPGSLKNALDWLVSSNELMDLPVLLINASPSGGHYAQPALAEILRVMGANVLEKASLTSPFIRQKVSADGTINDPEVESALATSLAALS